MPDYNKFNENAKNGKAVARQSNAAPTPAAKPFRTDPRCKICKHPSRHLIDNMIVRGATYTSISEAFGMDRRSASNHARKHIDYESQAIRKVLEEENSKVTANMDASKGLIVTKKGFLETALIKAYEQMVDEKTLVDPKVAIEIIEKLERYENENSDMLIEEIERKFHIFMQAVKKTVPPEMWAKIRTETQMMWEDKQFEEASPIPAGELEKASEPV